MYTDLVHQFADSLRREAEPLPVSQREPYSAVTVGLAAVLEQIGYQTLLLRVLVPQGVFRVMVLIRALRQTETGEQPFECVTGPQRIDQLDPFFSAELFFAEALAFFENSSSSARRTSFSNFSRSQ